MNFTHTYLNHEMKKYMEIRSSHWKTKVMRLRKETLNLFRLSFRSCISCVFHYDDSLFLYWWYSWPSDVLRLSVVVVEFFLWQFSFLLHPLDLFSTEINTRPPLKEAFCHLTDVYYYSGICRCPERTDARAGRGTQAISWKGTGGREGAGSRKAEVGRTAFGKWRKAQTRKWRFVS